MDSAHQIDRSSWAFAGRIRSLPDELGRAGHLLNEMKKLGVCWTGLCGETRVQWRTLRRQGRAKRGRGPRRQRWETVGSNCSGDIYAQLLPWGTWPLTTRWVMMAGAFQWSWPPDLFRSELVQSTEENRTRPAQGEENRACPTHGEEINELVKLIVRKKWARLLLVDVLF